MTYRNKHEKQHWMDLIWGATAVIIVLTIAVGIVAIIKLNIDAGIIHHELRVENVSKLLAGYEDCKIKNVNVSEETYKKDIIVMECKK
jgi:hypothetical protein